jgi:hypothetical protein
VTGCTCPEARHGGGIPSQSREPEEAKAEVEVVELLLWWYGEQVGGGGGGGGSDLEHDWAERSPPSF